MAEKILNLGRQIKRPDQAYPVNNFHDPLPSLVLKRAAHPSESKRIELTFCGSGSGRIARPRLRSAVMVSYSCRFSMRAAC